ncbi:carbohydrate kinase family protein [Methylocaldum sp.]|uniref:carbohydrate kinase family protein n=1 Tax=Methylocaldum sp. TaxID=1969727 RepID=UPI002D4952FC|nr:PfkB family carbohydrate kinase [Methylocaldum sp.]HYE34959.1 PfkB family carbohydrate kinase [Methylocaldum sp.]
MIESHDIQVLCVGHASYDLVFSVPHHPEADEKIFADSLVSCGGGPAANAAVTAARLGYKAAFAGYLGNDLYGHMHLEELRREQVTTNLIVRGSSPTPLSTILVKPDGKRALVNYKGDTRPLPANSIDFSAVAPEVILFDGHEAAVSEPLCAWAKSRGIPTVLDAGSLHKGTEALMFSVDFLVCSEKFARQWLDEDAPERALNRLAERSPAVVITSGEHGLIWKKGIESGSLPAFPVQAVDTTGAGDAFHGAFAAALASGRNWREILRYASAAGALCCTKAGARPGIPDREKVELFLKYQEQRPSY